MKFSSEQMSADLIDLMWRVKSTMLHLAEAQGLTPAQLFTLYAVLHGGNTMGRVADTLHCDASNVTGVVDRLVAQRLLVRSESSSDRRTKILALTDEGKRTIQGVVDLLPERLGYVRLSEQECQVLHTAVNKLTQLP